MLQEPTSSEEPPSPVLVAAWLVIDSVRLDAAPMWAAHWLVEGYDGEALVELAGLSGRDTRAVRDLLPAALADAGVDPLPSRQRALKVAFACIAPLHLSGRAGWVWAVNEAQAIAIANNYAPEVLENPSVLSGQSATSTANHGPEPPTT